MIRFLILMALVAGSCVNRAKTTGTVNARSGALFWEYEATAGVPDGSSRTYHENGKTQTDGYYLHGEKHGLHHAYDVTGKVLKKAFFWHDVLVWTTFDSEERPPTEMVLALTGMTDRAEIRKRYGGAATYKDDRFWGIDFDPPTSLFLSTDRNSGEGSRLGLQIGGGGSTAKSNAARRYSVYGHLKIGDFGAFFQLAGSNVASDSDETDTTIEGRRTVEVGGSRAFPLELGQVLTRVSFVVPAGHDDPNGFLAAAATSLQRPTDAIYITSSKLALRTSASWLVRGPYWVLQADAGLDAAVTDAEPAPAFGRVNTAFGLGTDSAMISLELANALQLNETTNRLQSFGLGLAFPVSKFDFRILVARTTGAHTTLSAGTEYAF